MANARRLILQSKLEDMLNSRSVYYQAPESVKMSYPAIRYSKKKIESRYANNAKYSKMDCYEIIVIDRLPDNEVIDKLMDLQYCNFDRHYETDGLNHDVFTLYY